VKDEQFYDGFVAQDVMKIFPNLVYHNVNKERKVDVYTMNYSGFGVIAIKAIQEQQGQMQELKDQLTVQTEEISNLKDEIKELKVLINKMTPGQLQKVNAGLYWNKILLIRQGTLPVFNILFLKTIVQQNCG